jgi:hypothetical protein
MEKKKRLYNCYDHVFVVVEEAAALPGASSSQIRVARGTWHAYRHIRGSNHAHLE